MMRKLRAAVIFIGLVLSIVKGDESHYPISQSPAIHNDKLLYVFDITSHGSTYPKSNIAGLEDPIAFKTLNGSLS